MFYLISFIKCVSYKTKYLEWMEKILMDGLFIRTKVTESMFSEKHLFLSSSDYLDDDV